MRKRSAAALVAALIVIAIGFFASFFFLFTDDSTEQYAITLPGQGTAVIDPSPEIGESNNSQLQTVQVDRTNIQAIVRKLTRPATYFAETETTYFYRGGSTSLTSRLWKAQNQTKIVQLDEEGQTVQSALLTEKWLYLWGAEANVAQYERQAHDEDLYRRVPTYEDLLNVPGEAVIEGAVVDLDGQLCLYAKTVDGLTGEIEQWYILAENGLLLYADGTLDGQPTYQCKLNQLQLSVDGENLFRLPDGTQPE